MVLENYWEENITQETSLIPVNSLLTAYEESMIIFFRYLTVENLSKMIASLNKRSKHKIPDLKKLEIRCSDIVN